METVWDCTFNMKEFSFVLWVFGKLLGFLNQEQDGSLRGLVALGKH